MKKKLLLGAFLLGSFLTANAQYSNSFEASEGYVLGDINGQLEWTISNGASATVVDTDATDGDYSLSVLGQNGAHTNLIGAFSNDFVVEGELIDFSFDINITALDQSDFYVLSQSPSQQLLTSRIVFTFEGKIFVNDFTTPGDPESFDYVETTATYEAATWINVRMVHNIVAETIEYYIDDTLIYTGVLYGGTNIEQLLFLHDNYASGALIDNIQITASALGTNDFLASQFSIYPNPASDVINIANAENILVNGIEIVDLNGRVVKSAKFNGVTEAQINISDLSSGMYLMNVSSDKGTTTKKIVKN